ncbi:MAG: phytanoyl-CoA dioxygenase family protein [Gemmatimonadales bacterium]
MKLLSAEQAQAFRRDGFLVMEGLCSEGVAELRERVELYASTGGPGTTVRFGPRGKPVHLKISQPAERDEVFRRMAQSPRLSDALEDLIGPARVFRDVLIGKPPKDGAVVRYH